MAQKDYYKILEVERNASEADIKKAFRRLAQIYHPDKHRGDKAAEEKFKDINEAYDVLKDPEKRSMYDMGGYTGGRGPGGPGRPGGPGMGEGGFGGDFQDFFGDVFSDFFGGRQGRGRRGPERGDDLRYNLDITFEEAVFGTSKKVDVPRVGKCPECRGSRSKPGTSTHQCPNCKGTGQQRIQQGFFTLSRPCPGCRGEGTVIESPCLECSGTGTVRTSRTLTVNIPAGVDNGTRLRVAGEGNASPRGGASGDLYIFISVKPHPIFKRDGEDIIIEVPISFTQAALGAEVVVPTIEGTVKLKIPAGTQTGKSFKLRGKGVAEPNTGRRGDQYITVTIETPAKLDARQRELLEEFARISNDDVLPHKKSFFDKVKDIFG